MGTLHIGAKKEEIAKTVLMPGDPLRAEYIAKNYLKEAKLVSDIRNAYYYTGEYNGKMVTIGTSGMGIPSMGIYSHELYSYYEVDNIIRIGTAGSINEKCKMGDVVIGMSSSTDSNYAKKYGINDTYSPTADYELLRRAVAKGEEMGVRTTVGNLYCTEVFYVEKEYYDVWRRAGALAVEMESYALYTNAALADKKALCICTVSDIIYSGERASVEERQNNFTNMMEIALGVASEI